MEKSETRVTNPVVAPIEFRSDLHFRWSASIRGPLLCNRNHLQHPGFDLFAAGAQAAGAPAAAGGLFSAPQSAAMGGYGVSAVIGAIQGTAALGAGAKLYLDKASKKKK
ncbi:uncharacterized protein L199_002155 [Kwoniella botswanensis]|uniref:uncharacterized protein n=1 Tax=Kwoniella botswanensis TaxID=1268659 RepID=UPI00315C878C